VPRAGRGISGIDARKLDNERVHQRPPRLRLTVDQTATLATIGWTIRTVTLARRTLCESRLLPLDSIRGRIIAGVEKRLTRSRCLSSHETVTQNEATRAQERFGRSRQGGAEGKARDGKTNSGQTGSAGWRGQAGEKIERRTCPLVHQPSVIRATDRLGRYAPFPVLPAWFPVAVHSRVPPRGIALIYVDTIFIRTDR